MEKLITLIYIASAVFWVYLTLTADHDAGLYLQLFLFVVPFLRALVGFRNAALWGGFKSILGKAVFFVAAGTFAWSIGMLLWNYYIFLAQVEVPYPSLADAAFILSWPL